MSAATQQLERVLLEVNSLGAADLRAHLMWIERAALAAENAAVDIDDNGAALHLRAALGAVVKWSQGDKSPTSLVELDALVRTLLARAQLGMLRGLADFYGELVVTKEPHRAACAQARVALLEMARGVERGVAVSPSTLQRFAEITASLG